MTQMIDAKNRQAMTEKQINNQTEELKLQCYFGGGEGIRDFVLISDATVPGFPILYASPTFELETGYRFEDIRGQTCRFLQGPDTGPTAVRVILDAMEQHREITVDILNYRKDGTPVWFRTHLVPVRCKDGHVLAFIGNKTRITAEQVRPPGSWS